MSTELARHEPTALAQQQAQALAFSEEQKTSIKSMIGSAIKTEVQFRLFLATAESLGLNPLAREIYGWTDFRDPNKLVTAVGIDGFRKKGAERCPYDAIEHSFCGEDGVWKDVWVSSQAPVACRCRIYVRNSPRAIEQVIYYSEFYVDKNPNWKSRPRHMMMVRAEAHCWRKVPGAGLANLELLEEGTAPPVTITEEYAPALAAAHPDTSPAQDPGEIIYDTPHQPEPTPEPVQQIDPKNVAIGLWQQLTGQRGPASAILECLGAALKVPVPAKGADVTPEQWQRFADHLKAHGLPSPLIAPPDDHKSAALALYDSLGGKSADEHGTLFDVSEALDIDIPGRYAAVTPAEWERFHAYLQEQGIPSGKSTPSGAETLNL